MKYGSGWLQKGVNIAKKVVMSGWEDSSGCAFPSSSLSDSNLATPLARLLVINEQMGGQGYFCSIFWTDVWPIRWPIRELSPYPLDSNTFIHLIEIKQIKLLLMLSFKLRFHLWVHQEIIRKRFRSDQAIFIRCFLDLFFSGNALSFWISAPWWKKKKLKVSFFLNF